MLDESEVGIYLFNCAHLRVFEITTARSACGVEHTDPEHGKWEFGAYRRAPRPSAFIEAHLTLNDAGSAPAAVQPGERGR